LIFITIYTPNHFVVLYPVANAATVEPLDYDGTQSTANMPAAIVCCDEVVAQPRASNRNSEADSSPEKSVTAASNNKRLDADGAESTAQPSSLDADTDSSSSESDGMASATSDDRQVKLVAGHKRGVVLVVGGYLFAKDKNVKDRRYD